MVINNNSLDVQSHEPDIQINETHVKPKVRKHVLN